MLEKEQQIITRLIVIFKQLPENDKNYLLGVGEGMRIKAAEQEEKTRKLQATG
ncbi:MAG: hypothetical protein HFI40_15415 [Lachnospiraceae bacterium]|jgi:hypothetical protein|nr:hypothetical protein [Lachnospiraceae bacterium]MCX4316318.1 hypothetical protein [Lachnospiraceae bacterium]